MAILSARPVDVCGLRWYGHISMAGEPSDDSEEEAPRRRRRGASKKKEYVNFRTHSGMGRQIEERVEELRAQGIPATKSSVARSLMQLALGNDLFAAELAEVHANIWHVTQRALGEISESAKTRLPDLLKQGMRDMMEERTNGRGGDALALNGPGGGE